MSKKTGPVVTICIGVFLLVAAFLPKQTGDVQFMGDGPIYEVDCTGSRWSDHEACEEDPGAILPLAFAVLVGGLVWLWSRTAGQRHP